MELLCFYKICNYICGACPSPCFSSLIYYKGIQVCDGIGIPLFFKVIIYLTIKNTCHESFHVAMSVCQFCNMSLGFKVGEDEHAAYIAGFAGGCAYDFLYSNSTE